MQLAPSLHRIGGPLVGSYLVDDGGGTTIIDAGLPGYHRLLAAELTAMGRTVDDIRAIVLTHGDTDHIGFAERLRLERGIPVFVHSADAGRARGEVSKPMSGWGPVRLRSLGGFLLYSARNGGLRIPPVTEVVPFEDGDVLDVPGAPRIVHQPGHTPGSVVIHVPTVDAVFMGDTMTTRNVLTGTGGVQPAPFTIDPMGARASLERLEGIEARWVLPGHGEPTDTGLRHVLDDLRAAVPAAA
jgi:glyoxylase-like metal-dependent hydrolase (beta-lactamase superfamily II)